jgi:hypothetical protein
MHLSHYGDKTAVQSFGPFTGLGYTARSLVDNLLLGLVGVAGIATPWWVYGPVLLATLVVAVKWWRQAADHRLMLMGLAILGSSYLLCYSARATWSYDLYMVGVCFARYHLLPQLGLAMFFCGGLPGRAGNWFTLDPSGALTAGQRRFAYWLIGICFVINLPRGLLAGSPTEWDQFAKVRAQIAVLRRIEEVDNRCRLYHISGDAAREVLGKLDVPCSEDVGIDGWDFLRGSDDPRPRPPDEVKRLLEDGEAARVAR